MENVEERRNRLGALSERIIGATFRIHNAIGHGQKETVYENAMMVALKHDGIVASQQVGYAVHFEGELVGRCEADVVVEEEIVLELEAVKELNAQHLGQCLNYLRASGLTPCLLSISRNRNLSSSG